MKKTNILPILFSFFSLFFLFSCNSPERYVRKAKKFTNNRDGDKYKALMYFGKAIEKDPNYAPAYFERGMYCIRGTQYGSSPRDTHQALEDFYKYLTFEPNNVEVWELIMKYESDTGKRLKAIDKVFELKPNIHVNYHRAMAYMDIKDYIQAKKYLHLYIDSNPNPNDSAYSILGDIAQKENKYYEAYEFYEKAKSAFLQKIVIFYIKNLAHTGDNEAKKFLAEKNISEKLYLDQAKELVKDGKSDEALELLSTFIMYVTDKSANMAAIYEYYATIKFNKSMKGGYDAKDARLVDAGRKAALEDVVRLCKKSVNICGSYNAYKTMGDAYYHLNKEEEAKKMFTLASKYNNSTLIYYDIALVDIYSQKYSSAIKNINKVIDANGESSTFLNLRGRAYFLSGQEYKAMLDLEKSLKLSPNNYNALEMMAIYNMEGNSYTNAFYYLQKIAEEYGKYPWMQEMVNEIPESYKTTEMRSF